jgi:hypothetical protein
VTIPANGPNSSINIYNVYGTIYLHTNQSILSAYGTSLNCLERGACLQIGDLRYSNDYTDNTVAGLSFRTPVSVASNASFAGVAITQTQMTSQVVTITTASAHGFRVGDMVTILFTDNSSYWGDATITAVPSSTTFQYAHTGANIPAQTSPGVVALAYAAVLDNAMDTHLIDISYDKDSENGYFNNFFDMWDDENATIDHFNNQGISLNANGNWTGSYVFSAGNQSFPIAPVITLKDSTITANYSNGVTDYNSNGLYIENTVLQATGPWEVYAANYTGNYQGAYLKNIYSEDNNALNPQSPVKSPFPGLGIAGLIAGASSGSFEITGNGGTTGGFASGGTGSISYTYFIVANDTTTNVQTSPMQIMSWLSTGTDSIPVRWPRVANGADAITYDVVRTATPASVGSVFPYNGGCPGGAGGICGYVAKGLTQAAACSGGFVCTYTDNGSSSTSAYTVKPGHYNGPLNFWPGAIVSVSTPVVVDRDEAGSVAVGLFGNPLQIASLCANDGVTSPGGYTTCLASVTSSNNAVPNQTGTLLSDGANVGNGMTLTKGRLNFTGTPGSLISAHHIITLLDSQPSLTQSTWGFRPPASANDTWIGTDTPGNVYASSGQLAFGAPLSITNYIAQTGDGIHPNWLERLTGSLKEFNVPAQFDQSVTLPGLSNGCLNVVSGVITSTGSACGSGGGGGGSVSSVFGRTGAVVAMSGDYSVGQVTGAAVDAAVVHLANAETITGAKTFTSNVAVSGNLLLPAGSGYVPAVGGIGLDTAAGLPVVNIGGTTQQVALTSSNISGQAGTALALAAIPTQCSGSFATGIGANGNANCTTPDVIQLPETTQPAGIANWGVFWFDSATHTPRAIDNNHVIQLGYTNLFNSDPGGDPLDNLEELNGSNPQNLRVYSNFVNNTTWTRMSLGYDSASGYQVLRSEDANSGNALGLGVYIGSSVKWGFAATGALKPSTDNSYDIGTDSGQAMRSVFAKTSFNIYNSGRQDFEFQNDGTNGTTLNSLAVYNSGASGVQTAATSSTDGVVGIVSGGAGTSNKAVITWAGFVGCNFDAGSPVAGDYVIASTTQGGKCHDTGSTARPSGVQVIGRIEGGGVRVSLGPPSGGGGGGAVSSVFGRTGAVTAATGDYSAAQVTGAAVDSTVVHLAGTETITGAKTFSSTVTLSGNLNVAGTINQTGTGPTQWSGVEWTGTSVTVPSGMNFSLGVGSDNTFHCQLASGGSCMPSAGGGMVWPGAGIANSTGSAWGASYSASNQIPANIVGTIPSSQVSGLGALASAAYPGAGIPNSTGSGWGGSYAVGSAGSDIPQLSGGLLPAAEIPNNAANTTGTAAGLSGTPTLPNGTTATTQSAGDNSTKLATTAYVDRAMGATWVPVSYSSSGSFTFPVTANKAAVYALTLPYSLTATKVVYRVGTADGSANTYAVAIYSASGGLVVHYAAAGSSFAPTANTVMSQTWSEGATVLAPGKYFVLWTSSCTASCATINAQNSAFVTSYSNTAFSVTTGGTAPTSITTGTGLESFGATVPAIIVE